MFNTIWKRATLMMLMSVLLPGCLGAKTEIYTSASDAAAAMPQRVYTIEETFEGDQITAEYRSYPDSSEGVTDTFFFIDNIEEVVYLRICTACTPIGSPSEVENSISVSLPTPFNTEAYTCNVVEGAHELKTESGQEYITCMYWMDQQLFTYKLYSVWDLEKTLRFLEQLELAE